MSNSAKHLVNTWKWQAQPYRKDSDPSQIKLASIPKWSRPATNNDPTKTKYIDYSNPPASGDCTSRRPIQARGLKSPNWWPKAKPIKHWRKQLQAQNVKGESRASYTIPYNIPNSNFLYNYDSSGCCTCDDTTEKLNYTFKKNICQEEIDCSGSYLLYDNGSRVCISGNPINNIIKPTTGLNTKLINPSGLKTSENEYASPNKKYNFSSKQYLLSKNKTYDQNLNGTLINTVDYSTIYNDSNTKRNSLSTKCNNGSCYPIVIKPNNRTYFQQGAVSSSSRIERLKYNTLRENAYKLKNTSFISNTGIEYGGNIITKKYRNTKCYKSQYHKTGNKIIC